MCLIAWNWQPGSPAPLLLIANRDEFHARPTQALHWWHDADILAGRDEQAGGSWLGVSRSGRLAALTNYRDPSHQRSDAPSRGELVRGFLQSHISASDYLQQLAADCKRYNPFNLLLFDGTGLLGLESRHAKIMALTPGLGAVSNADFSSPWPKLKRLQSRLQTLLEQDRANNAELLNCLHDPTPAPDAELPSTGITLGLERLLSSVFIRSPDYGTRACSIVRLYQDRVEFLEQSFDAHGGTGTRLISSALNGAPSVKAAPGPRPGAAPAWHSTA